MARVIPLPLGEHGWGRQVEVVLRHLEEARSRLAALEPASGWRSEEWRIRSVVLRVLLRELNAELPLVTQFPVRVRQPRLVHLHCRIAHAQGSTGRRLRTVERHLQQLCNNNSRPELRATTRKALDHDRLKLIKELDRLHRLARSVVVHLNG